MAQSKDKAKSDADIQTQVVLLSELPIDKQIRLLMDQRRIEEARVILNTRVSKSSQDYARKLRQFNLDAGWQLLKNCKFQTACQEHFNLTNVDPRELILLFRDLYDTSENTSLKRMVIGVPNTFLRTLILQQHNTNSNKIESDHREAKEQIRILLKGLNDKYVSELRNDPNKEAEFMTSGFS